MVFLSDLDGKQTITIAGLMLMMLVCLAVDVMSPFVLGFSPLLQQVEQKWGDRTIDWW